MQNATAALKRAAKRARLIAQQTGTAVVVIRDGQMVREIQNPNQKSKKTETTE